MRHASTVLAVVLGVIAHAARAWACSVDLPPTPEVRIFPSDGQTLAAEAPELVIVPGEQWLAVLETVHLEPTTAAVERPELRVVHERGDPFRLLLAKPLAPDTEYVLSGRLTYEPDEALHRQHPPTVIQSRFRTAGIGSGRLASDATLGATSLVARESAPGRPTGPYATVRVAFERPEVLNTLEPITRLSVVVTGVDVPFHGGGGAEMGQTTTPDVYFACRETFGPACAYVKAMPSGTYRVSVVASIGSSRKVETSTPIELHVDCSSPNAAPIVRTQQEGQRAAAASGCSARPHDGAPPWWPISGVAAVVLVVVRRLRARRP